ncbi:hypothetical protein GGTG_11263 [Gaeumannomyces tritici R3-111a-1]|uniref:Uncharacterized protein n=1 Tax=Gaeumannomyces tritici (strain R3-111a-1) TaxID=644352 RepID=J3PCP5_GAET3|nr:hypothetical protein GGTG_11263 [Gaeumannomyces tritici R3-111a-1]EJT72015.1 hypothetical protein GGTG_11263 [Gaeumannomyces tritici R3-111a-1]
MVSPNKSFPPVNRTSKARGRATTAEASSTEATMNGKLPAELPKSQQKAGGRKKLSGPNARDELMLVTAEPVAGPSGTRGSSATAQPAATSAASAASSTTVANKRRKDKAPERVYTHIPPTEEEKSRNGRQEGRSLISWKQPRIYEMLILDIVYETFRHGIDLPWGQIAHRLHPGSTPGAIHQALGRLRNQLIVEGHLVPPQIPKPGQQLGHNPEVRGQIRANEHGDPFKVRNVLYTENIPHRKFNLPDAVDFVNSNRINAPRITTVDWDYATGAPLATGTEGPSKKRRAAAAVAGPPAPPKRVKTEKQASADPCDLSGDEDYRPGARKATTPRRAASKKATEVISQTMEDSDGEADDQDAEGESVDLSEDDYAAYQGQGQQVDEQDNERDDEQDDEDDATSEETDTEDEHYDEELLQEEYDQQLRDYEESDENDDQSINQFDPVFSTPFGNGLSQGDQY